MKKQPITFKSGALPRFLRATSIAGLLPVIVLLLSIQSSHAGSATWQATPATGDWNTAANWSAGGPPNGSADTATFGSSNITGVSTSTNTEVNGIVFNAGASAFTVTASPAFILTISGVGITNNSGITQNFVAAGDGAGNLGTMTFTNSATAGNLTAVTNNGATVSGAAGGAVFFSGTSTAGNGIFTNNGSAVVGAGGSYMAFFDTSTAGNGNFTINGSAANFAFQAELDFLNTSTAGNGTFINNAATGGLNTSGGITIFADTSSAGNSTLIANGSLDGINSGGSIFFYDNSTGGTARVEVFGDGTKFETDGTVNFSSSVSGVTIGSIEGSGLVVLPNNLTVGSNNLSTTFSGLIEDNPFGTSGSLTKTGKGKLTLSNANTYTGGTTVSKGTLLVTNRTGSATGTGAVAVNAGTFGGTGKISGAVTIGTATSAAILAPGSGPRPGKLTLSKTITFTARANYKVDLNSTLVTADQVTAKGVTINSGATVTIGDLGTGTLTAGTVFTVINNTATTPIAGTFSNLADGSTLIVGSNTYKANYEGGTGNDLTLTVL